MRVRAEQSLTVHEESTGERSKAPVSIKPWKTGLKEKSKSRPGEEDRVTTHILRLRTENRQEAGMHSAFRDMVRSGGEAMQLLRSVACCLPRLELISLNNALLQAIGLQMWESPGSS